MTNEQYDSMKQATIEYLSRDNNVSTGHSPEDQALLERIDNHNKKFIYLFDKDEDDQLMNNTVNWTNKELYLLK